MNTIAAARILQALDASGHLGAGGLARVGRLAEQTGQRPDQIALQLGLIREPDLAQVHAGLLDVPVLDRDALLRRAAALLPDLAGLAPAYLRHARALPVGMDDAALDVALADPLDNEALAAIGFATGRAVRPQVATAADIEAALDHLAPAAMSAQPEPAPNDDDPGDGDMAQLRDLASDAPVIRLVNQIILRAVESRASDIHVEAVADGLRVRTRIDGVLRVVETPPAGLSRAIVSRIKIMARLDIAERRLAQDGRIRMPVRGREIDFRVSTTPSVHGESVVLRVLDREHLALDFAALGFDTAMQTQWEALLAQPHGILLATGPTGSGKTTTLYASLARLNQPEVKILTVEDPVEYVLAGTNQVQVNPRIGLTFATALRSFLRQDPDILMIGEIRDLESAQIAVQSALTGHLVLSTIHTNDSASAATRLLDMGMEDYLITSTVNAILAQRLVRCLCPHCRTPYVVDGATADRLGLAAAGGGPGSALWHPHGCDACDGTGYRGRTMILELLTLSDGLRPLILRHAEARLLRAQAVAEGMVPMLTHGMRKALAGITSVEEVLRAVRDT